MCNKLFKNNQFELVAFYVVHEQIYVPYNKKFKRHII